MKMYKKTSLILSILLCVSCLLNGCSTDSPISSPTEVEDFAETEDSTISPEAGPFTEENDITYFSIDGLDLKLDLAIPTDGDGPFPTIVFIFGGSWTIGGRDFYHEQIQWAAEKGYVGVTIDHRMLNQMKDGEYLYPFPAQIHDSKCVMQWLRANAEQYKIDKDRIGVVGYSSGGHLALLLALTDTSNGLEGDCGVENYSSSVQAAVGIGAPIDLTALYATGLGIKGSLIQLLGGTPDEVPEEYLKASPISYVSENDPPILIIMGELDEVIPPTQGELLDAKMSEEGIDHDFIVLEDKDHVKLGFRSEERFDIVFEFFDLYLK
jgi:acetyl esterase/lipase